MIIHDCEQRSQEWVKIRSGIPTASNFSKIVTIEGKPSKSVPEYALTLAAEVFAGGPVDAWWGNHWSRRGQEMEPEAVSLYEFVNDLTVKPVGFVTNDEGTWGCSPDGFVGRAGMIEIKCLKAEKHIGAILYHQKKGKPPTGYIQQTQGQLLICKRKWCDLVFYHPVLPLLVIRQTPIEDVVTGLVSQLEAVLTERDRVLASLNKVNMEKAA